MEILEEPATLVLIGIVFLFGGLGVLKLLRPTKKPDQDESRDINSTDQEDP